MYIATLHVHFKSNFIKIYLFEHQISQNPKKPTVSKLGIHIENVWLFSRY